jgi:predicted RND superfamily exporter protein
LYSIAVIAVVLLFRNLRPGQKLLTIAPPVAVAAFIGYTLQQRNGVLNLPLLVGIALSLVVLIAAVLDYRNLRDTLLMLVPAFGGGLVLLGIMALAGIELNPVNLIALPLVFAIGIDNGIYLVSDCRRQIAEQRDQYEMSPETFSSVLVTSLTSIAGFGSLLIAAHRGIFSMGLMLSIGVASCLIVAVMLMPSLLTLIARHQPASMDPVRVIRGDASGETAEQPAAAPKDTQKSSAAKTKKAA